MIILRRHLLELAPLALAAAPVEMPSLPATYPRHSADQAKEMVGASHVNVTRVRELLKAHPTLAIASWDWGFGDWETALGAASHVGNREIAQLLIENGAPPTLFSAAMLGQLEVVKAIVAATPSAQRLEGPHSIGLLAHAKAGGEPAKAVHEYLASLDTSSDASRDLSESEMTALAGTYSFGAASNESIEISVVRNQLRFTRSGATALRLFPVGDRSFHPGGAKAVRIRFTGDARMLTLTVHDPEPVLIARRNR